MNGFECLREIVERRIALLRNQIVVGIALIREGKCEEAYGHFAYYKRQGNVDGPTINCGRIILINRLLTGDDLVKVMSDFKCRAVGFDSAEVADWAVDRFDNRKFTDPVRFRPELVNEFYREAAMMVAEEWLHLLQYATRCLLAGQSNPEVDVAAYFENQRIQLSFDYLTRYCARSRWFVESHPEKESELRAFARKYQRTIDW